MATDPFIPPAQRALTGQTPSSTAGYRALQSRYSGEGYQPVGTSRTGLLRTYGAMTEGRPEPVRIDMPALTPPSPVNAGQPTGETPSTSTTLTGGVEGGAEYEKALSYGTKNYIPVGRAAGAGFGQVEAAQYPEYWRGVINYGLPPEEAYGAIKKQFGYELTDQEKGMVDPATGRPYAEAVRTIDNPNALGMSPYEAAFLSAEGRIPKAGYVTRKGQQTSFMPGEQAEQSKMKLVAPKDGEVQFQEYYVDKETGEKLDPSKFNFEQALKYGTAMEGGNRPDMFEISNAFTQPSGPLRKWLPLINMAKIALTAYGAGATSPAFGLPEGAQGATMVAPMTTGKAALTLSNLMPINSTQLTSEFFKPKPHSGFRY